MAESNEGNLQCINDQKMGMDIKFGLISELKSKQLNKRGKISKINIWENVGKFLVFGLFVQVMEGHALYANTKFDQKFSADNQSTTNYELSSLNSSTENLEKHSSVREEPPLNQFDINEFSDEMIPKKDRNLLSRVVRSVSGNNKFQKQAIDLCASEIYSGRIDSAVSNFKELNDDSLLPDIIEKSYNLLSDAEKNNNDKKLDNFDNLVQFIRNLPLISQGAIAFPKLYESMKSNNHLRSPKLLILSYMVQEYINMTTFINVSEEDKIKFYNLRNVSSGIIAEWATNIRNKRYDAINEFAKKLGRYYTSFNFHLPDIIESAYSNDLSNVEKIISCLRNLPYIHQYSIGYSALYDKMKINNHLNSHQLLMLAFRVKEVVAMPNYPDVEQKFKDKIENIKKSLPSNVQKFVWGSRSSCTIKNVRYDEYLYNTNDLRSNWVYTWVPGTKADNFFWKIEDLEIFNAYFNIRNIHEDKLLTVSKDNYKGYSDEYERREVYTVSPSDSSDQLKWRLIPEDGYFLMQDSMSNSYLYADINRKDLDRSVLAWKSSVITDNVKSERRWHLMC